MDKLIDKYVILEEEGNVWNIYDNRQVAIDEYKQLKSMNNNSVKIKLFYIKYVEELVL